MRTNQNIEAINFLKKENILDLVVKDMDELGYVGEEKNKKLGYLISISRKLSDPLSGVIVSSSSAGKSGLIEVLEKLAPPSRNPLKVKYLFFPNLVHKSRKRNLRKVMKKIA